MTDETRIPWWRSGIVRQQIVLIVSGLLGLLNVATDVDIDAAVTGVMTLIGIAVPVWTIITRLFKPTPPITKTAVVKEQAMIADGRL